MIQYKGVKLTIKKDNSNEELYKQHLPTITVIDSIQTTLNICDIPASKIKEITIIVEENGDYYNNTV